MKKIFTLLFVFLAALSASAEEVIFDFENNNGNWPVGEGANYADGNLTQPLVIGDVSLTGIQGDATQPCRLMKDNNGVTALYVYKLGSIKFNAPEGKALTTIAVTMKSGTFDLTANNGAVADNVWTGNATEVVFNHANSGNRQMLKIVVTIADENSETVKPEAVTYDTEVTNIAAFNALEDGKIAKLTLTNARVNGVKGGSYYVEDATGATVIKGVELTAATALNGYIVGKKSTDNDIDYMNDPAVAVEYQLSATDATTFEATATTLVGTVMTGADATTQANYGRLITLEDVSISGSGQNKTLTDAEGNTLNIKARDYMGVLPTGYAWPEKASKITGIVIYYMTGWFLMPISADAIVAAGTQPTSVTIDFSDANTFTIGTAIGDENGWIVNEEYVVDNVAIQITGGSAPSRIYTAAAGTILSMFKEYATLTLEAPEGYAITKLEFTNTNTDTQFSFVASSGAFTGKTWEGNAEGVRLLNEKSPQISKIVVTLAAKSDATVALAPINYMECANIAAFNALENGTYAKVTLTDAELTGISADGESTMWIQDASAGCWIQYVSLIQKYLEPNNKVNGFFYVVKRTASGNPQMKEAEDTPNSEFTQTPFGEPTMIEGTLAEVNVPTNLNKVVKIKGATLSMTSATAGTLTQGEATIDVNNGTATANQQLHKIESWTNGTTLENISIVAILVAKSATANQLLPISITNATGIYTIHNSQFTVKNSIYNLQGVRLNILQKGLNIVNGKKVMIK